MENHLQRDAEPTTITIEGTAEQQAGILRLLQGFELVNHDKVVTHQQACKFFDYLITETQHQASLKRQDRRQKLRIAWLEDGMKELERRIEDHRHAHEWQEAWISDCNEHLRSSARRCTEYKEMLRPLRRALEQSVERIEELESIIEQKENQIVNLESVIEQRDRTVDFVVSQVVELEEEVKENTDRHLSLNTLISQKEQIIEKVKTQYQALEQKVKELEEELATITDQGLKRKRSESDESMDERDVKRQRL